MSARPDFRLGRVWAFLILASALVAGLGCFQSADQWVDEGDRLLRDNDLIGAELAYNHALEVQSRNVQAIYGKGWALYASGHSSLRPAAGQLFQRAIDYDPEFFGGYRGRGVLLLEDGQVLAAESLLREAYKRAPNDPGVMGSLGQLYLQARRLDEAEQLFKGAVELAPRRGEIRRYLADLALVQGDPQEALKQIELGRAASGTSQRAQVILNEGEEAIRLEQARALIEGASGAQDSDLEQAMQHLDRAGTLLDMAAKSPGGADRVVVRRRYLRLLQGQVPERTSL